MSMLKPKSLKVFSAEGDTWLEMIEAENCPLEKMPSEILEYLHNSGQILAKGRSITGFKEGEGGYCYNRNWKKLGRDVSCWFFGGADCKEIGCSLDKNEAERVKKEMASAKRR